jgi:hypothetical protein
MTFLLAPSPAKTGPPALEPRTDELERARATTPAQAREVSTMRDAIDGDERSPDVTTRITAQREDRTRARDLELATHGIETNDEQTRTVTHACEGMAVAALFDLHALVVSPRARHLRAALATVRREAMRDAPAQRRSVDGDGHRGRLSRGTCHDRDPLISRA